MGMAITNGTQNVTGTVTSSIEEVSVLSLAHYNAGTAGTTTLGTVGAGKKWYIVGYNMSVSANTATYGEAQLKLNDVVVAEVACRALATSANSNSINMRFNYKQCPVITAGQTVKCTSAGASCDATCNVYYVEVTA